MAYQSSLPSCLQVLGAEIVLAPAVKRDSFANYFSTFKDQNEVSWTAAPLSSLLDVDGIVSFWQQRGLVVHRVRSGACYSASSVVTWCTGHVIAPAAP